MYFTRIFLLLLAYIHLSHQADFDAARTTLKAAKSDSERRLGEVLVAADASVQRQPLRELKDLYNGGYDDLTSIESFEGPGDKDAVIAASLDFWMGKMNDVVKSYVSIADSFKGVVISDEAPLNDPDWNNTASYKKTEEDINKKVEEAIASLRSDYAQLTKNKPAKLEELTNYSWKKSVSSWALNAAKDAIRKQGQLAKHDAAKGNTEKGISWLSRVINSSSANFKSNIQDIYSS